MAKEPLGFVTSHTMYEEKHYFKDVEGASKPDERHWIRTDYGEIIGLSRICHRSQSCHTLELLSSVVIFAIELLSLLYLKIISAAVELTLLSPHTLPELYSLGKESPKLCESHRT